MSRWQGAFFDILLSLTAIAGCVSPANAIVAAPGAECAPPNNQDLVVSWSAVGNAVPISPHYLITARHIAGITTPTALQWSFSASGQTFVSSFYEPHPVQDLALIRVEEALPGYFRLKRSPSSSGDTVVIGGHGLMAGSPLASGTGLSIGSARPAGGAALYARTTILSPGPGMLILQLNPGASAAALYDSGGGVFQRVGDHDELLGVTNMAINSGPYPAECPNPGSCAIYGGYSSTALTLNSLVTQRWIKQHAPDVPLCVSDYNVDGQKDVNDLFAYLNSWFAREYRAKVLDDYRAISTGDLLAYLNMWFEEQCG